MWGCIWASPSFWAGYPGPILGGYVTQWLCARDERWRAWLPGVVSPLGCVVPLALSLTSSGCRRVSRLVCGLAYGIYVASQAGILSGIQGGGWEPASRGLLPWRLRCFFNNLVGQALGLAVIGAVSDALAPTQGAKRTGRSPCSACALPRASRRWRSFAWTAGADGAEWLSGKAGGLGSLGF